MANSQPSAYAKSYNSFSGVDIKAVFGNQPMAELQAISYNITREKAPLYTMGAADPRSFSRGKRGIAGTLIFLVFDRHALIGRFGMDAPAADQLKFLSDTDDVRPQAVQGGLQSSQGIAANIALATGAGTGDPATQAQNAESGLGDDVAGDQTVVAPWFADQIPPFDVTLAAANEYGALAVMRLFGIEILNEGYGVSIDDIVSEQQMSYVCRTLSPWRSVALDSARAAQLAGTG